MKNQASNPAQLLTARVWDLPLRLFHWALLVCVVGSFASAKVGGEWMRWHFYLGYCALTLLMFRVVWGFLGSRYAQFASFLPNPMAAWRTARGAASPSIGHNPLGAFSIYAFLLSLSFQAVSGLFSNDDIAAQGPLVIKVSKDLSDQITSLHKLNEKVIIGLVLLHVAALLYYRFVKKEPLVKAMITGDKQLETNLTNAPAASDTLAVRLRGLVALCGCAACVYWIVNKL